MPNLKAEDFTRIVMLEIAGEISSLTFSPDGSLLAVAASNKVHVFKVPDAARPNANTEPPKPSSSSS